MSHSKGTSEPPMNLATRPQVQITVSMTAPTGSGSRDPRILLNETAHHLDGYPLADFEAGNTYDTYDGQNHTASPDWYALDFGEAVVFNAIQITMGLCYSDGGWWTSLAVEVCSGDEGDRWRTIEPLTFSPRYDFTDTRENRHPFDTYLITFPEATARKLRIIGIPGGVAQFTSLSRLAVYQCASNHDLPAAVPPPVPYVFQLIAPHVMWDGPLD